LGHRHCADGSSIADGIDSQTDNKGYTGHEMLGQLDLVHMNGRIYDPLVARMVSADPFIQDPEHSQSYNRYTYVWNNPTNLTDPTGFMAAMENMEGSENHSYDPDKGGKKKESTNVVVMPVSSCPPGATCISDTKGRLYVFVGTFSNENLGAKGSKDGTGGNGSSNSSASILDKISNFFSQANRSFGFFDNFVPSRASFESGIRQLWGVCDYNCVAHDAFVKSTADVMECAAQGVAEAGNRYYPELVKPTLFSALPL
jgi:RHS repeat-associated protein